MTAPLSLRVFEGVLTVHCPDPRLRSHLDEVWSRVVDPVASGESTPEITLSEQDSPTSAFARLLSVGVGMGHEDALVVSGAAVADRDGGVTALVGRHSDGVVAGTIDLAQGGMGYVTASAFTVAPSGALTGLPGPLPRIRSDGEVEVVGPDELGLPASPGPLRLRRVLVLDSEEEDAPGQPIQPLTSADAVVAVARHLTHLTGRGTPLTSLADLLEGGVGVVAVSAGEGDDITALVSEAVHMPVPLLSNPTAIDAFPEGAASARWALRDGRVRRMPYLDGVRVDDEIVLLVGTNPVSLGGIGLTLWEASAGSLGEDEALDVVVEVHGPHPQATELVADAVASMCAARVLARGRPQTIDEFREQGADVGHEHVGPAEGLEPDQ